MSKDTPHTPDRAAAPHTGAEPQPAMPEDWSIYDTIVTEDDTPVDNIFSERQQRLLAETLDHSWDGPGGGRPFIVLANVGLFYDLHKPPVVPDVMLSLDIRAPEGDLMDKPNRSYFVARFGKPPDVVIEIVSNLKGNEAASKLELYASIGVPYYAIFDPGEHLHDKLLRLFHLEEGGYVAMDAYWMPDVGLGLTFWRGTYAGFEDTWIRWYDQHDTLLMTGAEQRQRAEQERQRAGKAEQRASKAERRAERLAELLRKHGIAPDNGTDPEH